MQLCIALCMAELASAYPTSGGMYYWQYKLAGRRVGPFACWITGASEGLGFRVEGLKFRVWVVIFLLYFCLLDHLRMEHQSVLLLM